MICPDCANPMKERRPDCYHCKKCNVSYEQLTIGEVLGDEKGLDVQVGQSVGGVDGCGGSD